MVSFGVTPTIMELLKVNLRHAMQTEIGIRKGEIDQKFLEHAIAQKIVSRSIISMFPEIGIKPGDATDDDTIKLLKKYISQQKERLLYTQRHLTESDVEGLNPSKLKKLVSEKIQSLGESLTSPEIKIAMNYLPDQASEEEIRQWISENIDFSQYKNKMQAMGPIMTNFKGCDGNFVKKILLSI